MNHALMKKIALIALIVFVIGLIGSSVTGLSVYNNVFAVGGTTKTLNEHVEYEQLDSIRVELAIGVGQIYVHGGTDHLLDGHFIYDDRVGKPNISYSQRNGSGNLKVTQKENRRFFNFNFGYGGYKNEWDVQLNDQTPMDLSIRTGVGESNLNLNGIRLHDLRIDTGVGETTIDLSGAWQESFDIKINTGIGETIIYLPEDVGVKFKATKGIGSLSSDGFIRNGDEHVNHAYDTANVKLHLDLSMGIGDVQIITK